MASTIKIKRSAAAAAPTFDGNSGTGKVAAGELAWVHGTGGAGSLYVGSAAGSTVEVIGGKPGGAYCASIFANTPLTGTTTAAALNATGAITCAGFTPTGAINLTGGTTTVAAPSADTHAATKKYVDDEVLAAAPSMNSISDTDIGTGGAAPAAGHVLIYDGTNSWDNKILSGDVTMNASGVMAIQSIPNGVVNMSTDTNGDFVREITAVNNQTAVTVTGGAGNAGDSVAVGLAAAVTTPGNLTVGGNLVVNGTTTEVKTSTIELEDPVFVLGENGSSDAFDRGIQIKWNDGSAKTGFFGMDRSDEKFKFYADATFGSANQVTGGTLGKLAVLEVEGTIKTAAQNDITSATSLAAVGTITTGVWNGTAIPGTHGGTGISVAGKTGVGIVSNGTWSIDTDGLNPEMGGTGIASYTAGDLVYATGATTLAKLAKGTAGQMMVMNSGATAPEWTDTMDGGTWT